VFYEFLFFSAKGKLFNRKEWISGLMFLYQNGGTRFHCGNGNSANPILTRGYMSERFG
jgi:hypothetical protein